MVSIEKNNLGGHGLHARPAIQFVNTARQFQSEIRLTDLNSGRAADGKTIMGVLSVGAGRGHSVRVTITGADEALAAQAFRTLLETLFSE